MKMLHFVCESNYGPQRKCYPVVVTLEEWYLFGPRVGQMLDAAVKERLQKADISLDWLEMAPYSIMSADEFEDAAQIIDKVGVKACFDTKLHDSELRRWPFSTYLPTAFPAEWKTRRLLFSRDADEMFDRLVLQATRLAA